MTTCPSHEEAQNGHFPYDLRFRSCIKALTIDPDLHKQLEARWLPLVDVFERAEEIPALVHTSPLARIVQYELLGALCYATGVHPRTESDYRSWVTGRRSLTEVADELRGARFDGMFDLTHPEHPFGQNAQLAPYLSEHGYGPAQLQLDRAADYHQFFDHVHLHDPEPVPIEEAFVALLVQHAYGLGGRVRAKTDWFGSAFTYGSLGRLGGRVRTLALGSSLADTLRLNLTPTDRPGTLNFSWTGTATARRTFRGAGGHSRRTPDGPADLHSVLGRSALLSTTTAPSGEVTVARVLMGAGELLQPLGQRWLQDAVMDGDRPQQANAERALWRHSHALYAAAAPGGQKGTDLYSRLIHLDQRVDLWSVALIAKQRNVTGWVSDTFPFLAARHGALRRAAQDGVAWAEYLASAVRSAAAVARDVTYPRARPEERTTLLRRFHPGAAMWGRFEQPFHTLLEDIASGTDQQQALASYARAITDAASEALRERLRSLPDTGTGLEATVRAAARLLAELTKKRAPAELQEAAMSPPLTSTDTPASGHTPTTSARPPLQPHQQLGQWLAQLVRSGDNDALCALRRRQEPSPAQMTAAAFATREEDRPAFEFTAHLFATYHAALPWQEPVRLYGSGDLGQALRRIGSPAGRGPADTGCDLIFKRLTAPGRLSERDLEHAIARLRSDDRYPPSWSRLAADLAAWNHTAETVRYEWARSFYTPNSRTRQGATT